MPSDDKLEIPSIVESILLAELNLELPPFTFYKLIGESSDWSFILKLHAVLECALNKVLAARATEEGFDDRTTFFRKVELAFNMPEFAQDQHYRSFLITLNYVRNRFAHRANYIVANINSVINDLPSHKRSSVVQSLAVGFKIEGTKENDSRNRTAREAIFLKSQRLAIFNSAAYALDMLLLVSYVRLGRDGASYIKDYRPQLQDLLHDPAVIEMRRKIESDNKGDRPSANG